MTVLTKNLDSIPYDVFYQVASTLDCHDFTHLSRVNRSLNALLRSDSIARKTIEVSGSGLPACCPSLLARFL